MATFRSKAHTVEAWQYTGQAREDWPDWLRLATLSLEPWAGPGNWIVRREEGPPLILSEEDFRLSYEPLAETE